jgi:hypothetical protein
VTSGKLGLGAVRSNQIADGAVSARQIASGAVGSQQIAAAAVAPSNLQFPVFFAASPLGGPAPVPGNQSTPYPLSDSTWTQKPGQLNVIFGGAVATLAYDESKGGGSCQVYYRISINGKESGGGALSTSSTALQQVEQTVGVQPEIDPTAPVVNRLTVEIASNEGCTASSRIDSTRFRVLDFG